MQTFLKIGIVVASITMLGCGFFVGFYAIKHLEVENQVAKAQSEYWLKLSEQIGKPQIIEQRYYSPQVK